MIAGALVVVGTLVSAIVLVVANVLVGTGTLDVAAGAVTSAVVANSLRAAAAEAEAAPVKILTGEQTAGTSTLGPAVWPAEHALMKPEVAVTDCPSVWVPLIMMTGGEVVYAVLDMKSETAVVCGFSWTSVLVAASTAILASPLPLPGLTISKSAQVV